MTKTGFSTFSERMDYNFETQKKIGDEGEAALDAFYSKHYVVKPCSDLELQRRGVDRLFKIPGPMKCWFSVEYKTDHKAHQTGCAYIEVELNSELNGKEYGWLQKLFAQVLFYYVPATRVCYCVPALILKACAANFWSEQYPKGRAANKGRCGTLYTSTGLLVPLRELEVICWRKDIL